MKQQTVLFNDQKKKRKTSKHSLQTYWCEVVKIFLSNLQFHQITAMGIVSAIGIITAIGISKQCVLDTSNVASKNFRIALSWKNVQSMPLRMAFEDKHTFSGKNSFCLGAATSREKRAKESKEEKAEQKHYYTTETKIDKQAGTPQHIAGEWAGLKDRGRSKRRWLAAPSGRLNVGMQSRVKTKKTK